MECPLDTWFIVNPISGVRSKDSFPELLEEHLNTNLFNYKIIYTTHAGHGTEIAREAVSKKIQLVVAVGGDGTINEIATSLIGSDTALGIIPMGSGNGFARHLGIPLKIRKAIEHLNSCEIKKVDTGQINNTPFLCTAGIGFDAHISKVFAEHDSRGFKTYLKSTINEFKEYKPREYTYQTNGHEQKIKAFALTMANASQYGNNTLISPNSSIEDGEMEFCILSPFPVTAFPIIGLRLFNGSIQKSKFYKQERFTEATIKSSKDEWVHVDGEPVKMGKEFKVYVIPRSLSVFY
jgi:diacylglycerol kinase (ATP)